MRLTTLALAAALALATSSRRLAAPAAPATSASLPQPTVPLASLCALSQQYAVSLTACEGATRAQLDAGVDWGAVDRALAAGRAPPGERAAAGTATARAAVPDTSLTADDTPPLTPPPSADGGGSGVGRGLPPRSVGTIAAVAVVMTVVMTALIWVTARKQRLGRWC